MNYANRLKEGKPEKRKVRKQREISYPDPSEVRTFGQKNTVHVMAGIPCSHKSSYIEMMNPVTNIPIIGFDLAMEATYPATDYMHSYFKYIDAGQEGKDIISTVIHDDFVRHAQTKSSFIIDMTTLKIDTLLDWVDKAREYDMRVRVILMHTPLKECLEANENRDGKTIPPQVIQQMWERSQLKYFDEVIKDFDDVSINHVGSTKHYD